MSGLGPLLKEIGEERLRTCLFKWGPVRRRGGHRKRQSIFFLNI